MSHTEPLPDRSARAETLHAPASYPAAQLDLAFRIAATINRGKLVLLEAPKP